MNYQQLRERINILAKKIVEDFSKTSTTIAGAESCTGGAVASAIVSIPHASRVFKGSAVCYCDEAKIGVLGVKTETLKKYFAESYECASEMALNTTRIYKSNIAFATTGFLDDNIGEDRPENLKGCVFITVEKIKNGSQKTLTKTVKLDVSQERNFNRMVCVLATLELILEI